MTTDQIIGLVGLVALFAVGFALMFGNWKRKPGYPDEGDPAPVAQGTSAGPAEGEGE